MEFNDKTSASQHFFISTSLSSQPDPVGSPPGISVQYPCGACKILRRRCSEECVLAPYFPPSEPLKFSLVHKVFGASNMIKRLQEIPEYQRPDAVSSMIYEASARIRDPIYGCAGAVSILQQQNMELQEQLAKAQAEILNLKCQNANLVSSICKGMSLSQEHYITNITEKQPWENTSYNF